MNAFKIGMASALALATAVPALAQPYAYQQDPYRQAAPGPQYQPTEQYQRDMDRYQSDRAAYDANRAAYDVNRSDYRAARADYERRRANWEAARADYDARYGYGAYIRVYGPEPVWDDAHWRDARAADYYGRDTAYTTTTVTCRSNNSAVTAGVIGALAGAALGSNVAGRGVRTEGAVLGAVVGGGIGAAVGNAHDRYKCDTRGPYYSYSETIPYRESAEFRSGRYQYGRYAAMRCRLAVAPVDRYGDDMRYVRVCPDDRGRYRITG